MHFSVKEKAQVDSWWFDQGLVVYQFENGSSKIGKEIANRNQYPASQENLLKNFSYWKVRRLV